MDDSEEIELTEEVVLQIGNQILAVLGAEEPVTDLSPFTDDALYIELIKGLFEHLPLDDLQPGTTFEEKADNLRTLRDLLGETVVESDLSYISATAILNGDLNHLGEFLQILMQIIAALAGVDEGEGDQHHSERGSDQLDMDHPEENDSKTDTQKIKAGLGLDSPDDGLRDKELQDQLMEAIDHDDEESPKIQDEDEMMHGQPQDDNSSNGMEEDHSPPFDKSSPLKDNQQKEETKKQKVDVLHDPLFDDDDEPRSSNKKRPRAGSFGDKGKKDRFENEEEDDDEGIDFDSLEPEQKLVIIQQLYEEYQKDPDSFPDDQRLLLEAQIQELIDQGLIDGLDEGEESEIDDRMKVKGEINFPAEPLPVKTDDMDKNLIDKGGQELEVQEVDMKKKNNKSESDHISPQKQNYLKPGEEDKYHDQEESEPEHHDETEPDEEAQIISDQKHIDNVETSDLDDQAKFELMQKMQREQEVISKRIENRKKTKKTKKKVRPTTAKRPIGASSGYGQYNRPSTAKPKKKKKTKKRDPEQLYLEQLRQQELLQQLALEQQQMEANEDEEMEGNQIQITPEQAVFILQQLIQKQESGEELTPEEVEQFQFLQQVVQSNFQQQQIQAEQNEPVYYVRKTQKRKKSKSKKKVKKSKRKQMDERALLMMMQQQQMLQHQQHQAEKYGNVDQIQEVDEEETPIRELSHGPIDRNTNQDTDHQHPGPLVHDTDIPTQINAQVPAKFGHNEEEGDENETETDYDQQAYMPPDQEFNQDYEQENVPAVPIQDLYYLQERNKNQMIASKLENYNDLYNPLSE